MFFKTFTGLYFYYSTLESKYIAMKNHLLLLAVVLIIATEATAQSVGINTATPNASAALEVKASNKGLLIPRTSTASRNGIADPAKGLMVYDTTASSFWFYNGSIWKEITVGSNGWNLTGNAGTDTAVNFVGTIDGQPLLFKVNNAVSGKIDFAGNTAFGYLALPGNDGTYNSAFGNNALTANTTGDDNVALGYSALYSNITGYDNVANGNGALYANSTGVRNVAVGKISQYFNNGSDNTAIGFASL